MTIQITPVLRNLEFKLPAHRIADWHGKGVHVSHFFNAMSLFFPDGERFFIDSVRHYRKQITDPALKEQVRGFIGQEAMHGREHEEYNQALASRGVPVARYLSIILGLLNFLRRFTPKRAQLATTIALEHLTAIMANSVLRNPKVLEGSEEHFTAIWRWHALEETEHKAVAFDVFQQVIGRGPLAYLERCFALLMATSIFWIMVIPFHLAMVAREGKLFDLRGWFGAFNYLWISPGALRITVLEWLDYFKPGFHPWDHDNRQYLSGVDAVVAQVEAFSAVESRA